MQFAGAREERDERRLDPVITGLAALLAVIGLVFIFSTSYEPLEQLTLQSVWETYRPAIKQLVWLLLGGGLFYWASGLQLRRGMWFWVLAGLAVLSLAGVLIIGSSVHGSTRWFQVFGLTVQPSEFVKPVFILLLATLMSPREGRSHPPPIWYALGLTLLLAALIALEPDLGTALIYIALFFAGALLAGYDLRKLGLIFAGMALLALPGWFLMEDYQRERLSSFFQPGSSDYYQVQQSRIAIGSGGVLGKGFLKGSQKAGDYIFGARNDFIFAVIGEETGLIGGGLVLGLYLFLVLRLFWLRGGRDREFPRMVAVLVGVLIALQAMVNIGMNLGLLPVTGLPLPLISYGGSAFLATCFALGMAQASG